MISNETCARLILDFRERDIPKGISRDLDIKLDIPIKRAITIIGPRRSGKTYVLYSLMQSLLERGISKERILYINFEHPNLAGATSGDIVHVVKVFHELTGGVPGKKTWLFFDEIQNIPQWEKAIRHLLDTEHAQVFISGSSAKLLSKEIATALRGRTITYTLYPFSFLEFLRTMNMHHKKYYSSTEQRTIGRAMRSYCAYGGYPEAVLYPQERERIIQDIIETTIQQDVIERHHIRNTKVIRLMFQALVKAQIFSIHGWHRYIASFPLRVSKNSLYQYLDYFADAFVFFPLRKYSHSLKEQEQSLPKIYCIDNGIIDAVLGDDRSKKLENAVFLTLLARGYTANKQLFYYRTGVEVDFVIRDREKTRQLIQVCVDMSDYRTREREITALLKASNDLACTHLMIITADEEWKETVQKKKITCMPFWKWALQTE